MNAGPGLSEQELREAAAEAGISPEELRRALVERNGPQATGKALVRRSEGAELAQYSAETRLDVPPEQALERRAARLRQAGRSHRPSPGPEPRRHRR
ncbi:hypothetical protein [Nannocystis pusilla]|uniref:hypothetical protein n=1 Tax=Nannocystis pusilla TaxID=889268 RepID=UPI003DA45516